MFGLLALVLSLLAADPAAAQGCGPQNPNCIVPTAPVGTSNNQAASTEFVQQAIPAAGQPLTKTDDTNVTMTLGGSPATALVNPTSITMGWAGTLSVARGGTGIGSGTSGGIPYFNSATTIASSGLLGANQLMLGGGAGSAPASLGSLGTSTTVLHGNAGGAPSFGSVVSADIATNTVANSNLAQAPTLTFKGNNTGSTGNVADLTISQASAMLPGYGGGAGGRCTLQSGTPVMTSSTTGATTVYYTPYKSQLAPIWDGTNFVMTDVGGELSQLTTDTTKSPAAVANNSIYDVYVWNDNGTIRATRGPAWTNSTTRGSPADIFRNRGVVVNLNAITNGPAAGRGTYVCTIASNGTASIDYIFGSISSGGTAGRHMVWNYYNRVVVSSTVYDSGTTYTYSSSTIRQARASAGNQVAFVMGLTEDSWTAFVQSFVQTAAAANAFSLIGMGVDSNTVFFSGGNIQFPTAVAARLVGNAYASAYSSIGTHTISRLEAGDGTNANTMAYFGQDQLTFHFPM